MKILVVDDHPLVVEALRAVAARLGPETAVLAATSCEAGFAIADVEPGLELVLLDLGLPGLSGIPALAAWRTRFPSVPVVVVSGTEERSAVLSAMSAGASGFIPKSSTAEVLASALQLVLAGGKYVPPQVLGTRSSQGRASARAAAATDDLGLTERQLEVLRLIAQGLSNKLICRELGLAERTVKAHVTAVLRALKVSSRTQAALAAANLGLARRRG